MDQNQKYLMTDGRVEKAYQAVMETIFLRMPYIIMDIIMLCLIYILDGKKQKRTVNH